MRWSTPSSSIEKSETLDMTHTTYANACKIYLGTWGNLLYIYGFHLGAADGGLVSTHLLGAHVAYRALFHLRHLL